MRRACVPGVLGTFLLLGAGEGRSPPHSCLRPQRGMSRHERGPVKGGHLRALLCENLGKPFTRAGGQLGVLEGAGAVRIAATSRVSWAGLCYLSQGLRVCDFPTGTLLAGPGQAPGRGTKWGEARGRDGPGSAAVKMDAAPSALREAWAVWPWPAGKGKCPRPGSWTEGLVGQGAAPRLGLPESHPRSHCP